MNIESAIPHRPPFLLVDEVVEIAETSIKTRRTAPAADPVFAGHFPGNPILPGVLICESIFQSGALLMSKMLASGSGKMIPVLTRISNAKFKTPVKPGDVMEIEVQFKEKLASACFMSGTARVNGKIAVSIDFACAAVEQI